MYIVKTMVAGRSIRFSESELRKPKCKDLQIESIAMEDRESTANEMKF